MRRDSPSPNEPEREAPEVPPYEPPALIWEETWEPQVLAASCARLPGQSPTCTAAAHSP